MASLIERADGRVGDEGESLKGVRIIKGESDASCEDGV